MSTRSSASVLKAGRKSASRAKDDDMEQGKSDGEQSYEDGTPVPPSDFPLKRGRPGMKTEDRKLSAANVLLTPQMRSQRLIGNSNPRYRWEQYYKTEKQLEPMKKPL